MIGLAAHDLTQGKQEVLVKLLSRLPIEHVVLLKQGLLRPDVVLKIDVPLSGGRSQTLLCS